MSRICVLTTLTSLFAVAAAATGGDVPKGRIAGTVQRADGRAVAGAIVLVCEQTSGVPISRTTGRPFTESETVEPKELLHAITNETGAFAVENLAAGTYRVLAQSWPGSEKTPEDPLELVGRTIELHGRADEVAVPSVRAQRLRLLSPGVGTLTIDQDFGNDDTLLIVSTEPPIADPILMFWSWGDRHVRNMIGYNRMPKGATEIRGLPGSTVYLSVFANDNVPGFGGIEVNMAQASGTIVRASVVAGWSDGRHDPPERLKELFEEVSAGRIDVQAELNLPAEPRNDHRGTSAIIRELGPLDREIVLRDGRKATVGDLLACAAYQELKRSRGGKHP